MINNNLRFLKEQYSTVLPVLSGQDQNVQYMYSTEQYYCNMRKGETMDNT